MAFSTTTEPLSEIVWSPNKGFSLNCVDSSFADRNTSLYRDVEPSSMVLALLQSVTGGMSTPDEPVDDVFVKPIAVICSESDISSSASPTTHPTSDSDAIIQYFKAHEEHDTGSGMEKMDTARGVPNLPNDQSNIETSIISEIKGKKISIASGNVDHMPVDESLHQADEPQPSMEQNPSPRKHSNGGMDISFGNQMVVAEDGLYTKVEHINEYDEGSDALKSSSRSPSEKLESTEDNNLQTFNCEAPCAATSRVLASKSNENKNKSQGNELMLPCDKNLPVLHPPCNSRIHMTRNIGKEKSLSEGDANVSLLKEENGSHLSVESCCSTGLFSIGKKRCSFQQQLIVGSKRVKNQIQETSHSKPYVQQESSFMNLISNMMNGFSQSTKMKGIKSVKLNPGKDDTLLTLYYLCDSVHLLRACKNQDPEPQNTGSKSNFLSTYSQTLKNVGTRKSHLVAEASEDFELSNEIHGIDVTPIACYAENSNLYKQYFQSNKFQVSTSRYDAGPSLQPPRKFLNSHENRGNDSMECRNCYHLGLSKEKGMALHPSSTRHNTNNNENVECCALSERKETNNIFHKSDNLEGLWISRFFPKSTTPLMICDHLNEIGGSQLHSTGFSTLPHSHKSITYLHSCKIEETRKQSSDDLLFTEAKKLQNWCVNKEASTGLKDSKGNNDHTSKHNFNTVTPFPGLGDSEAMASMFARRLGAIKYMPTNRTDIIPHSRKTSSMVVHHLRSWC